MKRFNFAFDKLLKYRTYLQKEKEDKFALALKEYLKIDNVIKASQKESEEILSQGLDFIRSGDLNILYYREQARLGLKQKIKDYEFKKEEQSVPLEAARKELVQARKDKRAIEIIKEKKWNEYIKDFEKEEQEELDEFSLCL